MRTTLVIDDDILQAARELAAHENSTAGRVLSDLARKALTAHKRNKVKYRNGVPVFPARGGVITHDHIRKLMDEEGI